MRTRNIPQSALMTAFEEGRMSVWEDAQLAAERAYEAGYAAAEAEFDSVLRTLIRFLPDDVVADIQAAAAVVLDSQGECPF